ncbi:MAG: serine/threonine protein kinase [Rhodanobacteraceae bacterium]|nr:serine/threonine protein kinase [Rhodanobacteraceae bacterium]
MPASDADTHHHTRPATLAEDWGQLPANSADWAAGQRLGPYVLKRQLGKGGMGVVWLADQLQPLKREVAIKLLPRGQNNPLTEIYFEVERQALAQLSHRSIAQIYDAGRLPDGALFFAMEYVPGVPLDEFLEQHELSFAAIATLMRQICLGAHHAHQRALIHRDLKPLNILVQMADGQPLPKIIDFGVAIGALPGTAAPIRAGKAAGTPAYMSPEQKNPGADGIDARSDVYALGAVFAECLHLKAGIDTAHDHFESTTLREGLERSRGGAASASHDGNEAQASKLKSIPEALRAIAIKALAPDRDDRYDSAAAMADDLDQWLQKRPVRAMGGGRWYAARCFVNRYRLATAASAAIVIALLIGVLMALHGQNQARDAQALAEKRRDDAEQLVQFMLGDFADKLRPIGRLDLLDSVGQQALEYLTSQTGANTAASALSRARALRTLGEVRVTRQQFNQAAEPLRQAEAMLGPWQEKAGDLASDVYFEVAQVAFWRGLSAYRLTQLDQTEHYWLEYLAAARRMKTITPNDKRAETELASAYNNLGTLAEARNQFREALGYFEQAATIRRALATGPADRANLDLANSLSWIARIHNYLGEPASAWVALEEALVLIGELRRIKDDGQLRQRETTLRYLLGMYSVYRGDTERARLELENALALAKADVASDPTQPRRQALLARIAFESVRIAETSAAANKSAMTTAKNAMASLRHEEINADEQLTLEILACLAEITIDLDPEVILNCQNTIWPRILDAKTSASQDSILPKLGIELGLAIARRTPGTISASQFSAMERNLIGNRTVPQLSLYDLLLLQSLQEYTRSDETNRSKVGARIRELRASFPPNPMESSQ